MPEIPSWDEFTATIQRTQSAAAESVSSWADDLGTSATEFDMPRWDGFTVTFKQKQNVAAVSVTSWLDSFGTSVYQAFCPFFTNCENAEFTSTTPAPQPVNTAPRVASQPVPSIPPTPPAPPAEPRFIAPVPVQNVTYTGVSDGTLTNRLSLLRSELLARIAQMVAQIQATGGSGSGSSAGSASGPYVTSDQFLRQMDAIGESLISVSETAAANTPTLSDATIPDDITASNYLLLAGGTLTGALTGTDLTLSGNLTVSGAQTLSGAITIPYLTATSSTPSSFAGGLLSLASTTIGAGGQTTGLTISGGATTTGKFLHQNTTDSTTGFRILDADGGTPIVNVDTTNEFVGIWASSPNAQLSLGSNTANQKLLLYDDGSAVNNYGFGVQAGQFRLQAANNGRFSFINSNDSSEVMSVYATGNVGIGTTSPYAKLSVVGPVVAQYFHATSSGATSTFSGGLTTGSSGLNALVNGNVGIGTMSPRGKLHIVGASETGQIAPNGFADDLIVTDTASNAGISIFSSNSATGNIFFGDTDAGFSGVIQYDHSTDKMSLWTSASEKVTILSGGNVGIGTTSPYAKLSIAGETVARSFTATTSTATSTFAGLVGIGTTSPFKTFSVAGSTALNASSGAFITLDGSSRNDMANVISWAGPTGTFSLNAGTFSNRGLQLLYTEAGLPHQYGMTATRFAGINLYAGSATALMTLSESGDEDGEVGVSTTTPWGKLSVTNTGSFPSFVVEDSTSPDTTPFIITADGTVGIGTASPVGKLNVVGGNIVLEAGQSLALGGTTSDTPRLRTSSGGNLELSVGGGAVTFTREAAVTGGLELSNSFYVTPTAGTPAFSFVSDVDTGISRPAADTLNFYTAGSEWARLSSAGNLGIGTTTPWAKLSVAGTSNGTTPVFTISTSTASATSTAFIVTSTGVTGIGTTSPWRTLSVRGTVGFDGLTGSTGAGSLCLSASNEVVYNSGSDACLSSTRATKHDISPLTLEALEKILALESVSFVYNEGDGRTRYGFIAEDAAAVDEHFGTYDGEGEISGIDDRGIISVVVRAIQELYAVVNGFAERIVTKEIVAENGDFKELHTELLCVGNYCVTEEQFMSVFGGSPSAQPAAAAGSESQDSEPEPEPEEPADQPATTTPESAETPDSGSATSTDETNEPESETPADSPELDASASEPEEPEGEKVEEPAPADAPEAEAPAADSPTASDSLPQ